LILENKEEISLYSAILLSTLLPQIYKTQNVTKERQLGSLVRFKIWPQPLVDAIDE
jgi:hypothetical protein